MRDMDYSGIDLGQIQTFLTVAQHENFSSAAEALCITQPVASKRVAALENRLGILLFIRWKRTIRLTPAGKILYTSWSKTLQDFTEPINRAKNSQFGYNQPLVIGYYGSTFYYKVGASFQQKYPGTIISFIRLYPQDMKSALLSGQVNFVFYGSFAENELSVPPLKCVNLATYNKELWCRAGNRFSHREYVHMDELREENFVILDPHKHAAWAEQFNSMCSRAGFVPKIAASVDDILSLPMNLSTDDRIFIADGGVDINAGEYNLAKVKIANETSGTVLAWNSQHEKPEYFQFLDVSQKYFSNKYP